MKVFILLVLAVALVAVTEGSRFCQHGSGNARGFTYRGRVSRTVSGRVCQKWTAQKPHKHTRTPKKYKGKGLGNHNMCRNADKSPNAKGVWCYTNDPKKRWENCAVPNCKGLGCQKGKGNGRGFTYRGRVSVTKSGETCQKWTSQKPHKHTRTPKRYKGKGLGNHNMCRNADKSPNAKGVWCYTNNPKKRWENCAVPNC